MDEPVERWQKRRGDLAGEEGTGRNRRDRFPNHHGGLEANGLHDFFDDVGADLGDERPLTPAFLTEDSLVAPWRS